MSHGKPIYINGDDYDGDEFTICDNCGCEFDGKTYHFEEYECPEGMTSDMDLCEDCWINNKEEL